MVVQWQYCCLTAYGPNSGWHLSEYLLKQSENINVWLISSKLAVVEGR